MKPPSKSNFTHHDKLKKRVSQNILHALQVTSTTRKQATTPIFFKDIHLTAILFSTNRRADGEHQSTTKKIEQAQSLLNQYIAQSMIIQQL